MENFFLPDFKFIFRSHVGINLNQSQTGSKQKLFLKIIHKKKQEKGSYFSPGDESNAVNQQ